MKQLRAAALEPLDQLQTITRLIIESGRVTELYAESGVGRHARHVIDYYQALQSGLPGRHIDYNMRRRGSAIETDPVVMLEKMEELRKWGADILLEEEVNIRVESEISCAASYTYSFNSTIGREFLYIIDHSVHHIAHISLILKQHGFTLDPVFGLAPSTSSFLRQDQAGIRLA
ncbi:MAG: hypothetical protein RQ757_03310 [Pseudomonadales bacterium]|nr:hypothetical protein [Pseudomonadales bacterium]